MDILQETQEHCSRFQKASDPTRAWSMQESETEGCVVVHAFSDVVYNRSSIHLAGSEGALASVVADLVNRAQERLREDADLNADTGTPFKQNVAHHPYVGLVDHVSIMPLETPQDNTSATNNDNRHSFPATVWGRAARFIGESMASSQKTQVFYYGAADPNNTPLAEVRRAKTQFFQSGGLEKPASPRISTPPQQQQHPKEDVAIVGAPSGFVENFNIRLTSKCTKKMAQSLTRFVRERDGGLPGVEALTLPYIHGQFETACNLLQPDIGSVHAIQTKVEEWASKMKVNMPDSSGESMGVDYFVAKSYRVGTTAEQCRLALDLVAQSDDQALKIHNQQVRAHLKNYLRDFIF